MRPTSSRRLPPAPPGTLNIAGGTIRMPNETNLVAALIEKDRQTLLTGWLDAQKRYGRQRDTTNAAANTEQARQFLDQLRRGAASGQFDTITGSDWAGMRELLEDLSRALVAEGFSPTDTAMFVFSIKEPLFEMLRRELGKDAAKVADLSWAVTRLVDRLGLFTIECYAAHARGNDRPPAAGTARAVDPGGAALGRHPGAAADRHARQRAHPDRHGKPAGAHRRLRARKSPSSTSPACRPSTRWWRST